MRKLRVRNLKTSREYVMDDQAWAQLNEKGFASRFTIIEEIDVRPATTKTSYMPSELAAMLGLGRIEEAKKEEPPVARRRGQQRDHAQDG